MNVTFLRQRQRWLFSRLNRPLDVGPARKSLDQWSDSTRFRRPLGDSGEAIDKAAKRMIGSSGSEEVVDAGVRRQDVAGMATKSNVWRQMWGQRVGILGRLEILSSCRHSMSGVDKRMKMKVVIDR